MLFAVYCLQLRVDSGVRRVLPCVISLLVAMHVSAQDYNQIDEAGNVTQRSSRNNGNFNPHSNDTTSKAKEIPRGIYVWTIDRKFGDIRPAEVDTMPHLFMNSLFSTGMYGEYNTTGSNFTARESRIFADRPVGGQFIFTEPYSHIIKQPEQLHFTNTLSPLSNLTYSSCGNKQDGEDLFDAKFAVNAGKKTGMGFDLNYAYARGYYSDQSISHFGSTFYVSHLGDRYNLHAMFSTYHEKASENGGITDDEYIVHPQAFDTNYEPNEIPTILTQNWNRNDHQHLFITHRYNLGFYRLEKMTEEEMKARQFAAASKKDQEKRKKSEKGKPDGGGREDDTPVLNGRPSDAKIAGDEPAPAVATDSLAVADSTRIKVDTQAKLDSLIAAQKEQEKIDSTMKRVFVPVTSFIHTLEWNNHKRIYQAYQTPTDYYANHYYSDGLKYSGDSIYDQTTMMQLKNSVALALLEGFNKYAKAGLKGFLSHELRRFELPDSTGGMNYQERYNEHNVSFGGKIDKTQGKTLHYNLMAEAWLMGEDAGQLKVDFATDLNFPLLGDTVQLAANAYFYRLNPSFYYRRYHSRNLWWDNGDLSKETRTRIEGLLTYRRTNTQLRLAIEEIQNYTYLGMSYDATTESRTNMTAHVGQYGSNLNLLTAQLRQDVRLGPLNWENIVTYQNTSNGDVLPLPTLNVFSNLYLKFDIAHVLRVELGADASIFTKYYVPDFCPQLNQYAIQENDDSRVELGGFPFVDVYANMHLKRARFFVMMSNVTEGLGNAKMFLAPHYPTNGQVLRMGVSWNFFN